MVTVKLFRFEKLVLHRRVSLFRKELKELFMESLYGESAFQIPGEEGQVAAGYDHHYQ
jgi:hypothetical protein